MERLGPVTRSRSKKVAEASQQTGEESSKAASVISKTAFARLQAIVVARDAAILDAVNRINEHLSQRSSRSYGILQVARSVSQSATDHSVASSGVLSSHGLSVAQQRICDWVNSMENLASSSRHSQKATSVSLSHSDKSKISLRSVGTQAKVQAEKKVKSKKSVKEPVVHGPKTKKKSDVKSSRRSREKESDDGVSSSSESDDSNIDSSSDTDPPPWKSKKVKVNVKSKEEKKQRMKATEIKAPTYSGDAYVDKYLKQFRTRAHLAGWPKDEWGSRLLISLKGKARGIFTTSSLSDEPSVNELSTLLKKRFGGEASLQVWRATLTQRKGGERESLTELAHLIMEAFYPERDEDTKQDLATTYFVNALLDEGQQQYIFTHEIENLEQALKLGLAYENARWTTYKHSMHFRPKVHVVQEQSEEETEVEDEKELYKKFDELTEKVAVLAEQIQAKYINDQPKVNRRPQPQVSVLKWGGQWLHGYNSSCPQQQQVSYGLLAAGYAGCYACGDLSHFSQECPHGFQSRVLEMHKAGHPLSRVPVKHLIK